MHTNRGYWPVVGIALALLLLLPAACSEPGDEKSQETGVDRLRQALPGAAEMSIRLPESSALVAQQATFYGFTREITLGVNRFVWVITHLIEEIVETPPAHVEGDSRAVWGPYQDALSPAVWRVRVERVGERSFSYVVEGWPKGQDAAAARTVLEGEHTEGDGVHRGQGSWTFHLTVGHELDPLAHDSIGDMAVAYEVGDARHLEVTFDEVQGPRDTLPTSALYRYTEAADGSGTFDFITNADIDEDKPQRDRRELLQVRSRWLATGPGRSDVVASLGDLPRGMQADLVECWDTAFVRTYVSYALASDSMEDGDAGDCPYSGRELPVFEGFDPEAFADDDLVQAMPVPTDFDLPFAPVEDPVADPASLYTLTKVMVEGIAIQVKGVLAGLEEALKRPPSTCEAHGCTWGPWTDLQTGVSGRTTITRLGDGRFAFSSQARPAGAAEDAWVTLFSGEMSEAGEGGDGAGWFVYDLGALQAFEPEAEVGGSFRAELSREAGRIAIAVRFDQVVFAGQSAPLDARYLLEALPDGTGSLNARFRTDVDDGDPQRTQVELVEIHSRWQPDGAGVVNARSTEGDIEAGREVLVVQCWDAHAAETYVDFLAQAEGSAGQPAIDGQACVFTDWSAPGIPPMADEQ